MADTGSTRQAGLLAGMRIRKKLIFLHTVFSLSLAAVLLVALWPASREVIRAAEIDEAVLGLHALASVAGDDPEEVRRIAARMSTAGLVLEAVDPIPAGISEADVDRLRAEPGAARPLDARRASVWIGSPEAGQLYISRASIPEARRAVLRLYGFVVLALLGVYGLVAAALEVFVLPQHVYGPIRRMLLAEQAVQEGNPENELVPEAEIPADELGEIMRSRNMSIVALRQHERDLADALSRLEEVANDLKRKNHLLETARQNLADAGRLASLGMMSAGIAHELNTPLAVVKGLVEKLAANPDQQPDPAEMVLLLRVVGRLERLSEGLLDLARVRSPECRSGPLRPLVEEALTLVKLDRAAHQTQFLNSVPEAFQVNADADRLVQVLVNLARNAVDAIQHAGPDHPDGMVVEVLAERASRDGADWVSIRVRDNGPGIDPEVLSTLFEPFVSTRLDARGTGLGLAVAEGIVREHGGVLLARNRPQRDGAEFEIVLPAPEAESATSDDSETERAIG